MVGPLKDLSVELAVLHRLHRVAIFPVDCGGLAPDVFYFGFRVFEVPKVRGTVVIGGREKYAV